MPDTTSIDTAPTGDPAPASAATPTTESSADGTNWDADGANAWEEALIADIRANGGRPTSGPLEGHPLLLLYSVGSKSGKRRRSILTYSQQHAEHVVAGTAGGSKVDPAWVANVRANPQVEFEIGDRTFAGEAVLVEGASEERDRLWNEHVAQLPWFGDYPEQVGGRVIPMVRLRARGRGDG